MQRSNNPLEGLTVRSGADTVSSASAEVPHHVPRRLDCRRWTGRFSTATAGSVASSGIAVDGARRRSAEQATS